MKDITQLNTDYESLRKAIERGSLNLTKSTPGILHFESVPHVPATVLSSEFYLPSEPEHSATCPAWR